MSPPKLDAIALLKVDHRKVEGLFAKFESAKGDDGKQALAREICLELTIHAQIEEAVFYPACEGAVDGDLLKEAYVEHDGAKVLIAEIEAGGAGDEFYDAKVKVLSEEIAHHVEEEEKRVEGMFAQGGRAASTWTRSARRWRRKSSGCWRHSDAVGCRRPRRGHWKPPP